MRLLLARALGSEPLKCFGNRCSGAMESESVRSVRRGLVSPGKSPRLGGRPAIVASRDVMLNNEPVFLEVAKVADSNR